MQLWVQNWSLHKSNHQFLDSQLTQKWPQLGQKWSNQSLSLQVQLHQQVEPPEFGSAKSWAPSWRAVRVFFFFIFFIFSFGWIFDVFLDYFGWCSVHFVDLFASPIPSEEVCWKGRMSWDGTGDTGWGLCRATVCWPCWKAERAVWGMGASPGHVPNDRLFSLIGC